MGIGVFALLAFVSMAMTGAYAENLVTRAYQLKHVDAPNVIQVLNFAVANPSGKRIFAGSEKHLVVTDTVEQQETVAELLPVLDQPSTQTDPRRAQMELVVRASRYLQQKKKASGGTASPTPQVASSSPRTSEPPPANNRFTASVPYKSVYAEEDAQLSAKGHVILDEPVLPSLSAMILKGIFRTGQGSSLALLTYGAMTFTARDGGLYERNRSRVKNVTSQVFKDYVILTGPDRIPRKITFISTL